MVQKKLRFVVTSLQIEVEAENAGLFILNGPQSEQIDIVFDGADQIDANLFMIKGGGGALVREKVLMYSAKKVIILADSSKFVDQFKRSVPIEVIPFARSTVHQRLDQNWCKGGADDNLQQDIPILRIMEILFSTHIFLQSKIPKLWKRN